MRMRRANVVRSGGSSDQTSASRDERDVERLHLACVRELLGEAAADHRDRATARKRPESGLHDVGRQPEGAPARMSPAHVRAAVLTNSEHDPLPAQHAHRRDHDRHRIRAKRPEHIELVERPPGSDRAAQEPSGRSSRLREAGVERELHQAHGRRQHVGVGLGRRVGAADQGERSDMRLEREEKEDECALARYTSVRSAKAIIDVDPEPRRVALIKGPGHRARVNDESPRPSTISRLQRGARGDGRADPPRHAHSDARAQRSSPSSVARSSSAPSSRH